MDRKKMMLVVILLIVTNSVTAAIFVRKPLAAKSVSSNVAEVDSPAIQNMVAQLSIKAENWPLMNKKDRAAVVSRMIKLFQERENVAILKSPEFYSDKIDAIIASNPPMMNLTLPTIIKIAAVMEYDFYNGQNKDELAKQVLGPVIYEQNKARMGRT